MSAITTVFQKELRDNLRDRRSVSNALLAVLFNPLFFILIIAFGARSTTEQIEQILELPVVGAEHAPALISYLEQQLVEIQPAPADPEQALRAGEVDVVLVIPEEYNEQFRAGTPVTLELLYDDTSARSRVPLERTTTLLQGYGQQLGALRLLARGVNPAIVSPFRVEDRDVSLQGEGAGTLALLPVVILMAAFYGGYYLAADSTAGERERDSLEPLLVNPVPRWQLLLGKYLAVFLFALIATLLAMLTYMGLLALPPLQQFIGQSIEMPWELVAMVLLLGVPLVFMASALEMWISARAKTTKEAQSYAQYLSLLSFVPVFFVLFGSASVSLGLILIPGLSQTLLIDQLAKGEPIEPLYVLLSITITLIVGALALWRAAQLYARETIVMGG